MKKKLFVALAFAATAVGGAIGGIFVWQYGILKVNSKNRDGLHAILDEASEAIDNVIEDQ